jgi:hypothetical protein
MSSSFFSADNRKDCICLSSHPVLSISLLQSLCFRLLSFIFFSLPVLSFSANFETTVSSSENCFHFISIIPYVLYTYCLATYVPLLSNFIPLHSEPVYSTNNSKIASKWSSLSLPSLLMLWDVFCSTNGDNKNVYLNGIFSILTFIDENNQQNSLDNSIEIKGHGLGEFGFKKIDKRGLNSFNSNSNINRSNALLGENVKRMTDEWDLKWLKENIEGFYFIYEFE